MSFHKIKKSLTIFIIKAVGLRILLINNSTTTTNTQLQHKNHLPQPPNTEHPDAHIKHNQTDHI